ncbi:hypothetical protein [Rubritalea tangerina]
MPSLDSEYTNEVWLSLVKFTLRDSLNGIRLSDKSMYGDSAGILSPT